MPVYIQTLPKAGTYFLGEVLTRLGFDNTGIHLFQKFYLDTGKYSLEQNAKRPSTTHVRKNFKPVVANLKPNEFLFGHFPLSLNLATVSDRMKFIVAYRDPRKTMVSEFIDFRFRRADVKLFSTKAIPDDHKAFHAYLHRQGVKGHFTNMRNIVLLREMVRSGLMGPPARRFHFVHFDALLADPSELAKIAAFLERPLEPDAAAEMLAACRAAETKTKATDVAFDRDAAWDEEAEAIYENSGYPWLLEAGRKAGLTL